MKSELQISNIRIAGVNKITTPTSLIRKLPNTPEAAKTVTNARNEIHNISNNKDDRLVVVVGPCSVHDPKTAMDYAHRLKVLQHTLSDDLQIIMRVYFEKPRTTVGWKGLINDPNLDGSFDINTGLAVARKLLLDLASLEIPSATEFLDLLSPQYFSDLIAWGAIGARTTESQVHRELASGLPCPMGFKNSTDGNVQVAIDAIVSSQQPHHFLSASESGQTAILSTAGNQDCHLILRGGNNQPNYSAQHIQTAAEQFKSAGLNTNIMIDCSHANSQRKYKQQIFVAENIAKQIANGDSRIIGVMLESHIVEGRQNLQQATQLVYGQSITDACIGWKDTKKALIGLASAVRARRRMTKSASSLKITVQDYAPIREKPEGYTPSPLFSDDTTGFPLS